MSQAKPEKKKVWMRCRAHDKCEGQHAFVSGKHSVQGAIDSSTAGRVIVYECCTCKRPFTVRQ